MRIQSQSRIYVVNEGQPAVGVNNDSDYLKRVRLFLAKRFCDCCATLPTVALVLFALLIITLATLIPIAAVLFMHAQQVKHTVTDEVNNTSLLDEGGVFQGFHTSLLLPQNITSCAGSGFHCVKDPNIVIGLNKRCDGKDDCPDGSDENECQSCLTSFSCPLKAGSNQLMCLRGYNLCNGVTDCEGGEDEASCNAECGPDEYKCLDFNKCVPQSFVCDGDVHCPLGDDEIGCTNCEQGAKFCKASGRCIPVWEQCNGVFDCPDKSDEEGCDCKSCSDETTALCNGSNTTMCILKSNVCDGTPQCPVAEDEQQCAGSCQDVVDVNPNNPDIRCDDGTKFTWKYACSGLYPQCNSACQTCNKEMAFQCADKSACVHRSRICDNRFDCVDKSDEQNCTMAASECDSEAKRCDAFEDCHDGRDEVNCQECKEPSFYCSSDQKCIPSHQRCDGSAQCSDGSDEENCSCADCSIHPFSMYFCESGDRCYRRDDVCTPYSRCPHASRRDKMFCATRYRTFF